MSLPEASVFFDCRELVVLAGPEESAIVLKIVLKLTMEPRPIAELHCGNALLAIVSELALVLSRLAVLTILDAEHLLVNR
jgi:hypothetical protein